MKVLWFTNTPCSAAEKFGKSINAGGWLNSLEKEISKLPEIELAISFYSYETFEPFIHNGTQFYPVLRKGQASKFSRLLKRVFNNRNNDNREIKDKLLQKLDEYKTSEISQEMLVNMLKIQELVNSLCRSK